MRTCSILLGAIIAVTCVVPVHGNPSGNPASCTENQCDEHQFFAGFAKTDITPVPGVDEVPTLTTGPQPVESIQDPLFAKSVVLFDGETSIAFLAMDLCFLVAGDMAELISHIKSATGHDHLIVTVTHTHSGMFNSTDLGQLKIDAVNTINAAHANQQPVKVGAASTQIDEAYNRRIESTDTVEMFWTNPERRPNGPVDHSLGVIHLQTLAGEPLISLVNYSAHPTVTMDLENVVISADYPGVMASTIRQKLGGNVLFLLGAAGDINPYDSDTKPLKSAVEKSNELGEKLGLAAVDAIKTIDHYQNVGAFQIAHKSFDNPHVDISAVALTDQVAFATFPGEYFNAFGERLKQESPFQHTFFYGYANGSIAYVPTEAATKLGGYGADLESNVVNVSATAGDEHTSAAIRLLRQLAK